MAELVPCVGERQRVPALRQEVAGEDFCPRLFIVRRLDAKLLRQLPVELQHPRRGHGGRRRAGVEPVGQAGVGIVEAHNQGPLFD